MISLFKKKTSNIIYTEDDLELLDLERQDFYDDRLNKKYTLTFAEAYKLGKKLYERKFGELIGKELKEIRHNINRIYNSSLDENSDQYLDIINIQNTLENFGCDIWTTKHYWNYFKYSYRNDSAIPETLLSQRELEDYFSEYTSEANRWTNKPSKLIIVNSMKKKIRFYIDELLKKMYNSNNNTWKDFDITGQFLQVRALMIDHEVEIPPYVWNLIIGNPFSRIYRVCRDYMKWKKSFLVYKKVFQNVCDWENGDLYRDNEPLKKFETPLWIEWNKIGNDFLKLKTHLKKEEKGVEWLKNTVGKYIKDRTLFYNQLGKKNEYHITAELIKKYDEL